MDQRLVQAMDVTIENVIRAHRYDLNGIEGAMKQAAREVLGDHHRKEPRTWDSADISYDRETP